MMNTQTQEALKMAIEALIQAHKQLGKYWDADIKRGYDIEEMNDSPMLSCRDAIRACKEALAQPQPKLFLDLSNSNGNHPVQQEPVAWMSPDKRSRLEFARKDTVYGSHTIPLYTHPAPACDKVSRLEVIDNNGRSYVNRGVDKIEFSYQDDGRTLKIFTNGSGAKPTWQGLSDNEINFYCGMKGNNHIDFARAIEQALKEKNTWKLA